ncbi:MAG: hypothetical protein ACXAC7_18295 [Candidatus Hodarchaeales archaeon]|jgi:hypothetical protein
MFPPKVINRRVKNSILAFLSDLKKIHESHGWIYDPPTQLSDNHWRSQDVDIKITNFHEDGAIKTIDYLIKIPGIISLRGNRPIYGKYHKVEITLPREYPTRVDKIALKSLSTLFHPRFSTSEGNQPCVTINGELDRILMDLLYHILYEPSRVQPPSLYQADSGINGQAMRFYERKGPNAVHQMLLTEWEKMKKRISSSTKVEKKKSPIILD